MSFLVRCKGIQAKISNEYVKFKITKIGETCAIHALENDVQERMV